MAVLAGEYCETDRYIISKSLDNRVGCFLAVEAIKRLSSKHDLYFAFTAQEEVGARGAKTAAYTVRPDLALVIDATISYDTLKESGQTGLERGVALKAMDRSIVVSPKIKNWLAQTALEKDIPYQWEVISTGGTDSGPIHLTGEGIPTGGLAIPVRYLHTANEMAAKDDIRAAFRLLAALLGGESYPDLEQEVPSRP